MRYFPPHPQFTGRCQFQPAPEQTRSEWAFDAHLNYQRMGFLDAPDVVLSGSVRAIDIGDKPDGITLGVDYLCRP